MQDHHNDWYGMWNHNAMFYFEGVFGKIKSLALAISSFCNDQPACG